MDSEQDSPQEGMERIWMAMIRVLAVVIFAGYMMIWIMHPTNAFWLHWLPQMHAKVDSTFSGEQGTNILIYTFPMLFIAILGCLYVHLGRSLDLKTRSTSTAKSSCREPCRRPAFTKGPLGIVSWTELFFLSMFIGLLLWLLFAYYHSMVATVTQKSAKQMKVKVWEAKLEYSGLLLGLVGNICLAFLFFPVTRASSVLRLLGLTSESSIKYHIWLGHTTMILFTAHGLCYVIFWAETHQISEMLRWESDKVGVSNFFGEVALLAGLVMWATSYPSIRRKTFELFFYTHYLYILFVVFFILHVGFSTFCITLPGFYLFLIDRFLRLLQSQQKVRLISARIFPCEAVELNFFKSPGLNYNPSSIIFVNVPSLSKLQWHPFTVTSNSNMDPEKLSILVKAEGRWSKELYQKLAQPSPLDRLEVSVEGPYESASTNFHRHDTLVMVSGGSGMTPFVSIIRDLLSNTGMRNFKTQQVLWITAFKKTADLAMLDALLPSSSTDCDFSHLQLRIEAYITREKETMAGEPKSAQSIWFKPRDTDKPFSAVLGSYNWLWLGYIISTSFLIFLLLIGILSKFYIYPIDHGTNMRFPVIATAAVNMLFICISIAITATTAFLWNKKQNAKETRQIQNLDVPTPTSSPGTAPRFLSADRELESFPDQQLIQNTKVHHGERPNLKKLLLDCKGSNIGVLVSGPKKMRQEVAAICSSSVSQNLHFKSISFSW